MNILITDETYNLHIVQDLVKLGKVILGDYGACGSYCEDGISQQPGDQKRGKTEFLLGA